MVGASPSGTYTISTKKKYNDKVDSTGTASTNYSDPDPHRSQNKRTDFYRDTEKSVEKGGKQSYNQLVIPADDTGQTTFTELIMEK